MVSSLLWIILPILWSSTFGHREEGCPTQESIAPKCVCKNLGSGAELFCSKIMNPQELVAPIQETAKFDMFALYIINSSLAYIPSKLFVGTKYRKIRLVNSQLMSLSDGDLAFEGLEDTLRDIRAGLFATDAHYIPTWDWSQLRNHKKLLRINILMTSVSLDQKLPSWPDLMDFSLTEADISFIHPEAFSGLKGLSYLYLNYNKITEMKRSMFPDIAENLYHISLSNNQLESLPSDMFTKMPFLYEVILRDNKFSTLNEDTFLWPLGRLRTLDLSGNNFNCDCRIEWIFKSRQPQLFLGNCTAPPILKDMALKNITPKHLNC